MTSLVDIQVVDTSSKVPNMEKIRSWTVAVFSILERPPLALTVRIVGEEEMIDLNLRYRGKEQSTNVLSFPFESLPDLCIDLLGDVIVCGPVVEREAMSQHKSLMRHWAHLIVHGMLHLFGYDHQNEQQAEIMEQLEKKVLAQLGFLKQRKKKGNISNGSYAQI